MIRSFIGLPLPDHAVQPLESLQGGLPGARAVPAENMHLTLAFLDDQPEAILRALAADLDEIGSPPIEIRLSGLVLLGGKKPGAIAVGADGGERLAVFQARVARAVRQAGIDLERRRFRPHVTIFRLPKTVESAEATRIQAWISRTAPFEPITFLADRMALYRSILTKAGAIHDVLEEYPLEDGKS